MRTEARRKRVLKAAVMDSAAPAEAVNPPKASPNEPSSQLAFARPAVMWRFLVVASIAIFGLGLDLWTKQEVFARLGYPGVHPIWKGNLLGVSIRFQFETAFNQGALWGMGQGKTWLFASLSVIAICAIAYFLWTRQAVASRWLTVVTGLLLAGTTGNLYDRLGLHGWKTGEGVAVHAVRDFLDFHFFDDRFHWATFNFADCYLVIGACMLALHAFWTPEPESEKPAKQPPVT
jgi:signal peptidase II